jgi:putative addiction module killer protein
MSASWTVDVERIEKWLAERTREQQTAIARRLLLLQTLGDDLGMPNVRNLTGGLFELREMRFGFRIYFHIESHEKRIIVSLVGGDKASQARDLKKAREILK